MIRSRTLGVTGLMAICLLMASCSSEPGEEQSSIDALSESQTPAFPGGQDFTGNQQDGDESVALVEEDCDTYAGVGCPCETGSDCAEGYCLPTADGLSCTIPCEPGSCPQDWICQDLDESTCPGDCPLLCIPLGIYLCSPCETDNDCKNPYSTGGLAGDLACIGYGEQGAYCGIGCLGPEDCPTGYICANTETTDGEESLRCIAQDNSCECSALAIEEEASTLCTPTGAGTGCEGSRYCGPNGLTDCLAVAAVELCDGLDNDCDGIVDGGSCPSGETCECSSGTCVCACDAGDCEPTNGSCVVNGVTVGNGDTIACEESCGQGTQVCTDGVLGMCSVPDGIQCTDYSNCTTVNLCVDVCPTAPVESCNGADDNCDGAADETFSCLQGAEEVQNCSGGCGVESRTCSSSCSWGPWSGCTGGTCVPGETQEEVQACGNCGSQSRTRICNDCEWGAWSNWSNCSGQGTCAVGATEECNEDGCTVRVCNNSCQWGTCGLAAGAQCSHEGGTNYQCCGSNQWQFCSSSCQWYACQNCEPGSSCNEACP